MDERHGFKKEKVVTQNRQRKDLKILKFCHYHLKNIDGLEWRRPVTCNNEARTQWKGRR